MDFIVSDRVKDIVSKVAALDEVSKGIEFIREEEDLQLQQQCELAAVEAPTGDELERATWMLHQFSELGLENCRIDELYNVIGVRKGITGKKKILIEAHMDTVFPRGTVTAVPTIENGEIKCPGIGDNTRGCIALLSLVRALNKMKIKTAYDLIFVGTTREEGLGSFGGFKHYMNTNEAVDAVVCVDGGGIGSILYQATGIRTCEVNFLGHGGHASSGFGKYANPAAAAARAVAMIYELRVPEKPRTAFCVSNIHAGNVAGIHAIPSEATIYYNIRSNSQEELEILDKKIHDILSKACADETERWNQDTITYRYKYLIDTKARAAGNDSNIVQTMYETLKFFKVEPEFFEGGATNASVPIEKGIEAVCLGVHSSSKPNPMKYIHSLDERFVVEKAYVGIQHLFLLVLSLAGVNNATEAII